jgi:predicted TIM-barrel fold metal-dependent hydrolase
MEYREAREEVNWLTKLPSDYVREFVRFTTQPLEEPRDHRALGTLLSLVDAQELIMFSSDYPHHDFDSPDFALRVLPEEWHEAVFFENASRWYDIDRRLGLAEPARATAAQPT